MCREGFDEFLKHGDRSPSATRRIIAYATEFEAFLAQRPHNRRPGDADVGDLEDFVTWVETASNGSAKAHLWALVYFFDFSSNH